MDLYIHMLETWHSNPTYTHTSFLSTTSLRCVRYMGRVQLIPLLCAHVGRYCCNLACTPPPLLYFTLELEGLRDQRKAWTVEQTCMESCKKAYMNRIKVKYHPLDRRVAYVFTITLECMSPCKIQFQFYMVQPSKAHTVSWTQLLAIV